MYNLYYTPLNFCSLLQHSNPTKEHFLGGRA